jgi:thiamine phosphate synthase YjbQ (UPF0047 family)
MATGWVSQIKTGFAALFVMHSTSGVLSAETLQ